MAFPLFPTPYDGDVLLFWRLQALRQRAAMDALKEYLS